MSDSLQPHGLQLSNMTRPSWVALNGKGHSFIELYKPLCHDKAVIHEAGYKINSLVAQRLKHLPAMQETWVWSLGWEDSPGEGNGNPLQYSWLENPMDGGAWWATVGHRVGHDWATLLSLMLNIINLPDCSPELLQQSTIPSAHTRTPKSPHLCQHLEFSRFLDFLAENSGFCYQHSCWKDNICHCYPCPVLLWLPSALIFISSTFCFLLTKNTFCLHCWAVCFSKLKAHAI